jgi:hypothetical protein
MIAPAAADGSAGAGKVLTFGGAASAEIYPGAPLYSDPVDLPVTALQELAVSLYLPEETKLPSHSLRQTVSDPRATSPPPPGSATSRCGWARSSPESRSTRPRPRRVIVTLGDSITEGAGSTAGAYQSWPDQLAASPSR